MIYREIYIFCLFWVGVSIQYLQTVKKNSMSYVLILHKKIFIAAIKLWSNWCVLIFLAYNNSENYTLFQHSYLHPFAWNNCMWWYCKRQYNSLIFKWKTICGVKFYVPDHYLELLLKEEAITIISRSFKKKISYVVCNKFINKLT